MSDPTRQPVGTEAAVQEVEAELLVLLTRVRRRSREAARRIHPELTAVGYAVLLRVHYQHFRMVF